MPRWPALGVALTLACAHHERTTMNPDRAFAFTGVSVIPMDTERVIADQTVLIQGDRIVEIGPSDQIQIPAGAVRIDGKDKFLLPGLADMHVHAESSATLELFVLFGVTTIRNMIGGPLHLAWRRQIATGDLLGPTIHTGGELIDGMVAWNGTEVPATAAEVEALVLAQKTRGYDFVKFYQGIKPEIFDHIVISARAHGLPLAGHVPDPVGLERVLAARVDSIEHLTGYIDWLEADDSPGRGQFDRASRLARASRVDPAKIPRAARLTAEAGVWSCPTLVNSYRKVPLAEVEAFARAPEMRYVAPLLAASWDPSRDFRTRNAPPELWPALRAADRIKAQLVKALRDAGAPILLGTDMANPFVVPGDSAHLELVNLVDAGLTPFEALASATREAARFLGESSEFGTVLPGRRADLILLSGNPLRKIADSRSIAGVMVRGRWLSRADLDARLEALASSFQSPQPRFQEAPLPSDRRYALTFNDRPFGEERLHLEGSRLHSDLRTDAPDRLRFRATIDLDEVIVEHERPELTARLEATRKGTAIEVSAQAPFQPSFAREFSSTPLMAPGGRALTGPLMAGLTILAPRFSDLEIGGKRSLEVFTLDLDPSLEAGPATWEIERKPDEGALRRFDIEVKGRNWHESRSVFLDSSGEIEKASFDMLIAIVTAQRIASTKSE